MVNRAQYTSIIIFQQAWMQGCLELRWRRTYLTLATFGQFDILWPEILSNNLLSQLLSLTAFFRAHQMRFSTCSKQRAARAFRALILFLVLLHISIRVLHGRSCSDANEITTSCMRRRFALRRFTPKESLTARGVRSKLSLMPVSRDHFVI